MRILALMLFAAPAVIVFGCGGDDEAAKDEAVEECESDVNCKGERICVDGKCAEPFEDASVQGTDGGGGSRGSEGAGEGDGAGAGGESGGEGGSGYLTCPPGEEGCACYGNNTCNSGLTCASNLCVDVSGGGGVGGDGGSGSGHMDSGTAGISSDSGTAGSSSGGTGGAGASGDGGSGGAGASGGAGGSGGDGASGGTGASGGAGGSGGDGGSGGTGATGGAGGSGGDGGSGGTGASGGAGGSGGDGGTGGDAGCEPDCGDRECGLDPVCNEPCGICTGGECDEQGQCDRASAGGPYFIRLEANRRVVTETANATVFAVVGDPDGPDDIIGGSLSTPDGALYGTFVQRSAGVFSIAVNWDNVNAVEAIEGPSAGVTRVFRVQFLDQDSNSVSQDIVLVLRCSQPGYAPCSSGQCTSISTSTANCGACGHACPEIAAGWTNSACVERRCDYYVQADSRLSCAAVCGSLHQCIIVAFPFPGFSYAVYEDNEEPPGTLSGTINNCLLVPPAQMSDASGTYDFSHMFCLCREATATQEPPPPDCTPNCDSLNCGYDPACGESCGACPSSSCSASGQCDPAEPGVNAPSIIQHGANAVELVPGGSVTFSILATDPNGSANLVGALLTDAATGNLYGVFGVDAPGTFSLTLSWDDIHATAPIHQDTFGPREFLVEVFDNEGNRDAATEVLSLVCDTEGLTPCHGACTNLQIDPVNCGECDHACPVVTPPLPGLCTGGICY